MPGLVPGIHVFFASDENGKSWMAGTSPAMAEYRLAMTRTALRITKEDIDAYAEAQRIHRL